MSEIKWTQEQLNAINKSNSNILVAAAAGSGKTAVLVERIIKKIIYDKIDIDKILIVTFTNAAASEMREKILDALYKKIDENPSDYNLQRQINLLNKSNICTIDSFCLDVLRNNFFEINISANARVADETEIIILKQETIEEIFEEKYMNEDKDFLELIDTYTKYNKDEDLENLIIKIYDYMQTNPFPEKWINEKVDMFSKQNQCDNFSNTIWGKTITEYIENIIEDCIIQEENLKHTTSKYPDLIKFLAIFEEDIENYNIIKSKLNNWDDLLDFLNQYKQKPWPKEKNDNPIKEELHIQRNSVKKEFDTIKDVINCSTKQANEDIGYMYNILEKLKNIILEFTTRFEIKKREKNIIDFNDMEHLALKILINQDKDCNITKTDVAKRYTEKFKEIAIDEYQDSNLVQEYILNSVSNGKNIFMVGDVKQSIYKFRQACPELFLKKYNTYKLEPDIGENRKIKLFRNFRSRKNILDFTNLIFKNIMRDDSENIDYTQLEYLNLGSNYEDVENQNYKVEIDAINLKEDDESFKLEEEVSEEDTEEVVENVVLEAKYVANKIKKIIESKYKIYDKNIGIRDVKYSDIAILLRSANEVSPIYEKEISDCGINVYSDKSISYLETTEVLVIMALLKIINNPMQDIPLVTVARSVIGNFTDNELIEISMQSKEKISFYEKMLIFINKDENKNLKEKIEKFIKMLEVWREEEKYKPLDELIWQIYIDTNYINYVKLMPNGELKVANLKMLFEKAKEYEAVSFKGLYNFINFIDKLHLSSSDKSSAKIIGENENVVRIMSIHKSKGLEFPIVILSGTNKRFNFTDLNKQILLHQNLGIGPQYIDDKKHIEFSTLPKIAISNVLRKEIISEEMRVLYVALTRAKEKLIITGVQKDVNKFLSDKDKILEPYKNNDKIKQFLVQNCKSYLEWIEYVYLKEKIKQNNELIDFQIINKSDILKEVSYDNNENNINIENKVNEFKDIDIEEKIIKLFEWKYDFKGLENTLAKTSVTKIKELYENDNSKLVTKTNITDKPAFLNTEEIELNGAEKGTLIHLCIKNMNEKVNYDIQKIKDLIQSLVLKEIITTTQAKNIDVNKLYLYTKSNLWESLKNAEEVNKEQPFYIMEKNVLVQGIIDLYYINSDNQLILIDYKTDRVNYGEEINLLNKYDIQLNLYKKALEQSLSRKVDKYGIYAVQTGKLILKGE